MDPSIDSFHERFDLPNGGRTAFAHNQFRAGYVGDGETVYLDEGPSSLRLGDVVLSSTVAIFAAHGSSPLLSVTLSAKLPSGDYRALAGSGSWDYGAALRFTKRWARSSAHAGYAYNALGEWRLAPGLPLQNTRSLFAAFTYAVTPDTGLVLQVLRNAGPFPYRSGNDLGKVAMGFSGGFRHRLPGGFQLEWSLIENIDRYYNNYDVGAYFGLSYGFGSTPAAMTGVHAVPDQTLEESGG